MCISITLFCCCFFCSVIVHFQTLNTAYTKSLITKNNQTSVSVVSCYIMELFVSLIFKNANLPID